MDLDTPITTAARRIVRELNQGTPDMMYFFDLEGRYVTSRPVNMYWASEGEDPTENAVVSFRTRVGVSQRTVQDHLDAYVAHPDDVDDRIMYLVDLYTARDASGMFPKTAQTMLD